MRDSSGHRKHFTPFFQGLETRIILLSASVFAVVPFRGVDNTCAKKL